MNLWDVASIISKACNEDELLWIRELDGTLRRLEIDSVRGGEILMVMTSARIKND